MYSPADLPSSMRAAPAKKRRLSAENGISSRDAINGLPTLTDSSCASSSAFSSMTSASLCRSSDRSFGVFSSQSGRALFAASTALSTSSALQRGTSAITSPVAGAMTSMVSPETLSTNSPPTRILYAVFVALITHSLCRSGAPAEDPGVAHQALREENGDDRQENHGERDRVHDGKLLPEADVAEDQQRQRVVRAGCEVRDDDLVEGQRESEEPACDQGRREHGPDDEAERLAGVCAEVGRGFDQRRRRSAKSCEDVVVDDHDAARRVPDRDCPQQEIPVPEDEE